MGDGKYNFIYKKDVLSVRLRCPGDWLITTWDLTGMLQTVWREVNDREISLITQECALGTCWRIGANSVQSGKVHLAFNFEFFQIVRVVHNAEKSKSEFKFRTANIMNAGSARFQVDFNIGKMHSVGNHSFLIENIIVEINWQLETAFRNEFLKLPLRVIRVVIHSGIDPF